MPQWHLVHPQGCATIYFKSQSILRPPEEHLQSLSRPCPGHLPPTPGRPSSVLITFGVSTGPQILLLICPNLMSPALQLQPDVLFLGPLSCPKGPPSSYRHTCSRLYSMGASPESWRRLRNLGWHRGWICSGEGDKRRISQGGPGLGPCSEST